MRQKTNTGLTLKRAALQVCGVLLLVTCGGVDVEPKQADTLQSDDDQKVLRKVSDTTEAFGTDGVDEGECFVLDGSSACYLIAPLGESCTDACGDDGIHPDSWSLLSDKNTCLNIIEGIDGELKPANFFSRITSESFEKLKDANREDANFVAYEDFLSGAQCGKSIQGYYFHEDTGTFDGAVSRSSYRRVCGCNSLSNER